MNRAIVGLIVASVMLAATAYAGWTARGWQCAADMADFKQGISDKAEKQRDGTRLIEDKQEAVTDQSSNRLDQQQATQQKEIVYVDKQVIQYRDRWRDRSCKLTDDWLQLYNASLFGDDPAMPEASAAGSATAGPAMLLPAGRD